MGYHVHVVKPSDYVRLDGHGKPDLAATRAALEEVAKACVERKVSCALIDARNAQGSMSVQDFYTLIGAFYEMGFRRHHRLALLHGYTGGQRAALFAACASSRGWEVQAFEQFEEAMEWFGSEPSQWWLVEEQKEA